MFRQFYDFSQLPLADMPDQAEVKLTMRSLPAKVIFLRRVPFHFSEALFDFFEFALREVRNTEANSQSFQQNAHCVQIFQSP